MVTLINKYITIYDNQAYVNKLSLLLEDDYHRHGLHKATESEALSLILQILPKSFHNKHILGHQDDKVKYEKLSIKARLNVDADKVATNNASIPKNTHISSAPLIMYINNKYIHYKFDHSLRRHAHVNEAGMFLRKKYKWNNNNFQDIYWPQHSYFLNSMIETRKRHAI